MFNNGILSTKTYQKLENLRHPFDRILSDLYRVTYKNSSDIKTFENIFVKMIVAGTFSLRRHPKIAHSMTTKERIKKKDLMTIKFSDVNRGLFGSTNLPWENRFGILESPRDTVFERTVVRQDFLM